MEKVRSTFARLNNIWKSNVYGLKTKIRLFKTLVKPVLLYGAECWRMTKWDISRVSAFHDGRRTIETELAEMGLSWGLAQMATRDRDGWRDSVHALCPPPTNGGKKE